MDFPSNKNSLEYMGTDVVNPLLTDFYQFSMVYAHWKNGRVNERAVFDLYFRKCPFNMNFCVFGGLDECIEFIKNYKLTERHINYLRTQFPQAEEEFFKFLSELEMSDINVYGYSNSEFVLPNEPILTLEGPLAKVQIVESTLLNLTNYPTLISSLAFKLRMIKGLENKLFVEDGTKHAQTPNGALIGVKYSSIGGVDYSTYLLSSKIFDLNLFQKTTKLDDEVDIKLFSLSEEDFIYQGKSVLTNVTNKLSEESYLIIKEKLWRRLYPLILSINQKQFTYEIISEKNLDQEILLFTLCCLAIKELNIIEEYYFITNFISSLQKSAEINSKISQKLNDFNLSELKKSNKLKLLARYDPEILKDSSNFQFDNIDGLILGTEFTVSQTHPALGMVYKINEINNSPCIKFSEEKEKQTIPGNKKVIRLFDQNWNFISDVLCLKDEINSITDSKEIEAYLYNQFNQKYKLSYVYTKIMNPKIFSKGIALCNLDEANILRKKVMDNYKSFTCNKEISLYISNKIREIIINETKDAEDCRE